MCKPPYSPRARARLFPPIRRSASIARALPQSLLVDPFIRRLFRDVRYHEMLAKIGLPRDDKQTRAQRYVQLVTHTIQSRPESRFLRFTSLPHPKNAVGAAGPALGLFEGARFGTTITQLSPGDLVLLFTDGIIEAESATGTEWGLAGLKQTVLDNLPVAGSALLNRLLANARSFTGTSEFADDVCLAAVELPEEQPTNA
jgi:hypothetical protein